MKVLAGKALLEDRVDNGPRGGFRDLSFGFCADGEGLDVRDLFMHPVSRLFDNETIEGSLREAGTEPPAHPARMNDTGSSLPMGPLCARSTRAVCATAKLRIGGGNSSAAAKEWRCELPKPRTRNPLVDYA